MTMGRRANAWATAAAAVMTCTATADFTQAIAVSYTVTAADFGGAQVTVHVKDI